jgi:AhpD family alkylhydroperoxidase
LPLSKLDNVGRETRKAFAAAVTVKPADSIISVRINSPGWGIAIEGYHVATVKLWTDDEVAAVPAVKAVFDDIRATRKSDFVNNFWRALANQPSLLERTWASVKQVMIAPGVLDPLTKELVYIAISTANSCSYCIHSHTAAARAKVSPMNNTRSSWRSSAWLLKQIPWPTRCKSPWIRSSSSNNPGSAKAARRHECCVRNIS